MQADVDEHLLSQYFRKIGTRQNNEPIFPIAAAFPARITCLTRRLPSAASETIALP
jgi:hypothetical protein